MATRLETLLARRDQVKAKLAVHQKELDSIDAEIREMGRVIDQVQAASASPTCGDGFMAKAMTREHVLPIGRVQTREQALPITPIKSSLTDEIAKLLQDAGDPMMPAAIVEALQQRGVQIPGDKPANNVSAHLSYAKERFVRAEEGWTLRTSALPLMFELRK